MRLKPCILISALIFSFAGILLYGTGLVESSTDNGIKVIRNPASPFKDTVKLKLERIREINPYNFSEVGFQYYRFIRSPRGEVILYDPYSAEAHLFGARGRYQKSVSKLGQGPGEFLSNQGLVFHFFEDEIWGSSHRKIARFDRTGELLDEQTYDEVASMFIENRDIILDTNHHICLKSRRLEEGPRRMVVLEPLFEKKESQSFTFYQAVQEWSVRKKMSAYTNEWGTPNIWFAYCPVTKRVYCALSTEYLIHAYDLDARPIFNTGIAHKPIKIGRKEKAILIPWAAKDKKEEWALDAFPDTLASILSLHTLDGGYLAVLHILGPEKVEIDIIDPDGRYIYALQVPEGMSLEQVQFFDQGFATQETRDDYPVYVEYRITNLPDIFK